MFQTYMLCKAVTMGYGMAYSKFEIYHWAVWFGTKLLAKQEEVRIICHHEGVAQGIEGI